MPQVKTHMVSNKKKTPLFYTHDGHKIKLCLEKGSWVGVLHKNKTRYLVVTTQGDGWIDISDVEEANNFSFKVERDEKGFLHYAI